ncbi:hypothetical protein ACTL6U_04410 [Rhodovibrionaceae bacterium A322]
MKRLAALALAAFLAAPFLSSAQAKGIVSEVQYYKEIKVVFSDKAHVCGLKDPEPIKEAVIKHLNTLDIPHNPDSETSIMVGVTADAAGLLAQRCIAYIDLQLRADLEADFIDAAATQNEGQIFTVMNTRGYVFPVIFFQAGSLFSDYQPEMKEKALGVIDLLMEQLAAARRAK